MKPQIPILVLKQAEKLWLKEVCARSLQGDRFTFREIHSHLHNDLPKGFRPLTMDPRLVSSNGEQLHLLGLLALEGNINGLTQIDQIVHYVRQQLLADPKLDRVTVASIVTATGLESKRVSLLLQMMRPFGEFYTAVGSDVGSMLYKDIQVSGSDAVYYQYLNFTGIEQMIAVRSFDSFRQSIEVFSFEEMIAMNERLDKVIAELSEVKAGQEEMRAFLQSEIEELKALYPLGKKNWGQLLIGKLAEMVAGGIVSETISKGLLETIRPAIEKLLHQ